MSPIPSLTVVLPVHNAEKSLARKIARLLDILPDLTSRFEILLIDDASMDQTAEVAHDLAREYPQIVIARHDLRTGRKGVVDTALRLATGDVLFIQDENAPINSSRFHRLWMTRTRAAASSLPWSRFRAKPDVIKQLIAWGVNLSDTQAEEPLGGVQILRREMPATNRSGRHFAAAVALEKASTRRPG